MKGACVGFFKCLVTLFNCILMMVGLAISAVSLWVFFDAAHFREVSPHALYGIAFLIGLGAVMTFMGFLGCCGALIESQCMLGMFFFLVLVLFAGQTAFFIWCQQNLSFLETNFTEHFRNSIQLYDSNEPVKRTVDALQKEFHCCGSSGPSDWQLDQIKSAIDTGNVFTALSSGVAFKVPRSCCVVGGSCYKSSVMGALLNWSNSQHYKEGCSTKLFKYIRDHETTILGVILSISAVELLALIFSCVICRSVRKNDELNGW